MSHKTNSMDPSYCTVCDTVQAHSKKQTSLFNLKRGQWLKFLGSLNLKRDDKLSLKLEINRSLSANNNSGESLTQQLYEMNVSASPFGFWKQQKMMSYAHRS